MAQLLIGLGANLGDVRQTFVQAIDALASVPGIAHRQTSQWVLSSSLGGPPDQPPYLNGVALFETDRSPNEVLVQLQSIEDRHGRTRGDAWMARTLDLDLLLYDDVVLHDHALSVPHPRMAWRRFVLAPAAEIVPDWVHPVLGWRIDRMLAHLDHAPPLFAVVHAEVSCAAQIAERLAHRTDFEYVSAATKDAVERVTALLAAARPVILDAWPLPQPEAVLLPSPKMLLVPSDTSVDASDAALRAKIAQVYNGPVLWANEIHAGVSFETEAATAITAMACVCRV